jgi:TolB protein
MKKRILTAMMLSLLFFPLIEAQGETEFRFSLERDARKKIAVAVPNFITTETHLEEDSTAEDGADILKNDLSLSGFFDNIDSQIINQINILDINEDIIHYPKWEEAGAQALIKGEYASTKNGITFKLRLYDIVNKKYLAGKLYRGRHSHLRKLIHKFADEVVYAFYKEKGIAQTKISFVAKERGRKELFVIDYDGNNLKQYSKERSLVLSPEWSPDGKKIVFTTYRYNNPDLKVLTLKGKKTKVIASFPGLNTTPAWSPDGKKIALTLSKDGNPEIYLLNSKGKLKRLTNFRGIDTSPTWSPDGEKIAFTSDRSGTPQIYIMDATKGDSSHIKRITFNGNYNDLPVWSPLGDKIAYSSKQNSRFQILIRDLNNGNDTQITNNWENKESPSWSPNGRFLAFSSAGIGGSAVYVVKSNGTGMRRLTFLKGGGFFPAWSPVLN